MDKKESNRKLGNEMKEQRYFCGINGVMNAKKIFKIKLKLWKHVVQIQSKN